MTVENARAAAPLYFQKTFVAASAVAIQRKRQICDRHHCESFATPV
jgi:hypothetical protein